MRTIEGSGLGTHTPVLTRPGKEPLYRMLMRGDRYCTDYAPALPQNQFNPAVGVQTCDVGGDGAQCTVGTPVAALSGLGVFGCKSLDLALDSLKQTMKAAEDAGIDSPAYNAAKSSTVWDIAVVIPFLGNDCDKYTNEALRLEANLRASLDAGTQASLSPAPTAQGLNPEDKTADTVKFVAVAVGITVAVGGVIYLVGPFVRALAKAGARRVR